MGGDEATRIIRQVLKREDLPIIALTADVINYAKYKSEGFTEVISKASC